MKYAILFLSKNERERLMKNKTMYQFALYYFLLIGGMGCFYPYINVYLEQTLHLSGGQIGLINSVSLLISIMILPIWGMISDKTKRYKDLLLLSLVLSIISLYFYSKQSVYLGVLVLAILFKSTSLPSSSLSDTITIDYTKKHGGDYGLIRGMGSFGYCIASVVVGKIIDYFNQDGPLFICYMVMLLVAILLALSFPKPNTSSDTKEKVPFTSLFKNKNYLILLLVVLFSQVVIDSAGNYNGNHLVVTLGGSYSLISIYTFLMVLPEALFLMVASKVINKLGYKKYMLFAIGLMILRLFIYSQTHNPTLFIIVSLVHCFGVALSSVLGLSYIQEQVDPNTIGTAISFYNVTINLGNALFGYVFGIIYQYQNSFHIYLVSSFLVLISLFLVLTHQFEKQI